MSAEIEHSKSLQAKASTAASSAGLSAAIPSSQASAALEKLRDELTNTTQRMHLSEDLCGLSVQSYKDDPQTGHPTYNCILQDCLGRVGALNFKLQFRDDGSVRYNPDLDPERDPILADALPEAMQNYTRFRAEDTAKWFRSLFKSINQLG